MVHLKIVVFIKSQSVNNHLKLDENWYSVAESYKLIVSTFCAFLTLLWCSESTSKRQHQGEVLFYYQSVIGEWSSEIKEIVALWVEITSAQHLYDNSFMSRHQAIGENYSQSLWLRCSFVPCVECSSIRQRDSCRMKLALWALVCLEDSFRTRKDEKIHVVPSWRLLCCRLLVGELMKQRHISRKNTVMNFWLLGKYFQKLE